MPNVETQKHTVDTVISPDALSMMDGQKPEGACVRYEACGNIVPGRGEMCAECLDEVRHDEIQAT